MFCGSELIFFFYLNEFGFLQRLLKEDGFYTIRVPSNVLNSAGKEYVISSVRAVS